MNRHKALGSFQKCRKNRARDTPVRGVYIPKLDRKNWCISIDELNNKHSAVRRSPPATDQQRSTNRHTILGMSAAAAAAAAGADAGARATHICRRGEMLLARCLSFNKPST